MKTLSKIEISKKNLIHNVAQFRHLLSDDKRIVAMVKANAYGHGVKEVVEILENTVDIFGVDDLDELKEIREYTQKPVIVFGYVIKEQLKEFIELDAILGVYDLEIARELNELGGGKIHVKIDAFLGRQGILLENVKEFFGELKELENIEVEAIYSHFSNIEDTEDLAHTQKQHKTLLEAKRIAKESFPDIFHHISATSGFLTDMENNWGGEMLRLGIGMYGIWPSEGLRKQFENNIELKPVMQWVTHVAQVKEIPVGFPVGYGCTFVSKENMKIAVIPQGYSDGYDRGLSNIGEVLISGKRCSVLGRIAMNMFVVDVSGLDVKVEDEVVLLGKQGDDEITAEGIAEKLESINYEVVTRIWPKLKREVV